MLNVPKNFQVVMETSIEVAIKYIIEDILVDSVALGYR